jgi:chemotaxis protein histidine kinase CheA
MGRIPFKISGGAETEPASAGVAYDGPMPKAKIPYRCKLKRLSLKVNSNKDHMLNFVAEINEPKTKNGTKNDKAECNGYGMWGNLNITDQGKPWVNQFLYALVNDDKKIKAVLREFWGGGPRVDDEDKAQPGIVAIGTFKIDPEGMPIVVQGKRDKYEGDESIKADRFLMLNVKPGEDDEADEDESDEYADDEEEVAEDEEEAGEDEEELPEGYAERDAELSELARPKLVAEAKKNGITKTRGVSDEDLIVMILDAEFPPEEEEADEEEADEEEADEEPEEDEEEEAEEEPEPPAKPTRRTRASAAVASKPAARKPAARARKTRADDDEVPY